MRCRPGLRSGISWPGCGVWLRCGVALRGSGPGCGPAVCGGRGLRRHAMAPRGSGHGAAPRDFGAVLAGSRHGARAACGCGRAEHGRWGTDIYNITRRVRKYCSGGPVYALFGRGGSSERTSEGAAGSLRGLRVWWGRSAGAGRWARRAEPKGRASARQRRRVRCRPRRWSQRVAWRWWTSCRAASRRRRLSAAGMTL